MIELQKKREKMLNEALKEIKILSGLLPICSRCKKKRSDKEYWNQLEVYIDKDSESKFSREVCPECAKKVIS